MRRLWDATGREGSEASRSARRGAHHKRTRSIPQAQQSHLGAEGLELAVTPRALSTPHRHDVLRHGHGGPRPAYTQNVPYRTVTHRIPDVDRTWQVNTVLAWVHGCTPQEHTPGPSPSRQFWGHTVGPLRCTLGRKGVARGSKHVAFRMAGGVVGEGLHAASTPGRMHAQQYSGLAHRNHTRPHCGAHQYQYAPHARQAHAVTSGPTADDGLGLRGPGNCACWPLSEHRAEVARPERCGLGWDGEGWVWGLTAGLLPCTGKRRQTGVDALNRTCRAYPGIRLSTTTRTPGPRRDVCGMRGLG